MAIFNKLEYCVNEKLSEFGEVITTDCKIARKYGDGSYGIDHILTIGNDIITVQDKWENNPPKLANVNHFIMATHNATKKSGQKLLLALFVSKRKITRRGYLALCDKNKEFDSDKFYYINNDKSEEDLANDVYNFISKVILPITKIKNKWILYDHQIKTVETFKEKIKKPLLKAIVSHPTGTGKTVTALHIIGEFWKLHPTESVLWITERKDVLESQFSSKDKFNNCINSGFIQDYSFFELVCWYNKLKDFTLLKSKKPIFLVTNVDAILSKYEKFDTSQFGLIILDECHSSGAALTFEMLKYFIDNWINLKGMIGFSATPIRMEDTKFKRTAKIFGDGNNVNFLSRFTLIDCIDKKIIVPPKFYWVETKLDRHIKVKDCNGHEYLEIIKMIKKVLEESKTKKSIAWARDINNANEWKKILERYITDYKIFISHTREQNTDLQLFMTYDKPCMLICVGRCREGFDDPKIDVGINLDAVAERGTIVFIQETGRTLRTFGNKDCGIMMDTFTFVDKEAKMKQLCNIIVGYCLFLMECDKREITLDKEYKQMLKCIKGDSENKNITLTTPLGNIIQFNIESYNLHSLDWNDLPKNLVESIKEQFYSNGITYERAKTLIRNYETKIWNKEEYKKIRKIIPVLPEDPELTFKGQFIDWIDYLEIERIYYNIDECKAKIKEYIGNIKFTLDLSLIVTELCMKDNKFPPNTMWVDYYKINTLSELIEMKKKKKSTLSYFVQGY
jgi:superfamily II DNA or RNA helicase